MNEFMDDLNSSVHAAFGAVFAPQETKDDEEAEKNNSALLDQKHFVPRRMSMRKMSIDGNECESQPGMGVWTSSRDDIPALYLSGMSLADAKRISTDSFNDRPLTDSPITAERKEEGKDDRYQNKASPDDKYADGSKGSYSADDQVQRAVSTEVRNSNLHPNVEVSALLVAVDEGIKLSSSSPHLPKSNSQLPPTSPIPQALSLPPTWDPQSEFCYPVAEMPTKLLIPDNLTIDSFDRVQHFADGSNANVFRAFLNGQQCIIKMIRAEVQHDPVAVHEFDCEHGMLVRFSHPNVIKIMGAGRSPRRFVVLEYLANGSLHSALSSNVNTGKGSLFNRHRPTFGWPNLLAKARDLADAFDYLHRRCCEHASVLHRDLKPDNVGFTADGTLKLFDFGLCTAVRRRCHDNEAYDMTGNTGSLRYMAPEGRLDLDGHCRPLFVRHPPSPLALSHPLPPTPPSHHLPSTPPFPSLSPLHPLIPPLRPLPSKWPSASLTPKKSTCTPSASWSGKWEPT